MKMIKLFKVPALLVFLGITFFLQFVGDGSVKFFGGGELFSQTRGVVEPTLSQIKRYIPEIIAKLPHDPRHFTQGLKFYRGQLYETTGLYEESRLIRYHPVKTIKSATSSTVTFGLDEQIHFNFPNRIFAEDLEIVNNQIYVLSWREDLVYVFNDQFKVLKELRFDREGWGIAFNGKEFITSDGSEVLTFREPNELRPLRYLQVQMNRRVLKRINAIEWINGFVYANVWFNNNIYIINPQNGLVVGIIESKEIVKDNEKEYVSTGYLREIGNPDNVLNGIAYDSEEKVFYLTGKRWMNIYKVKLK